MDTLFVVGIDGVLGANLALVLGDRFRVAGAGLHAHVELDCAETFRATARTPAAVRAAIEDTRPDWVVHCGPLARASWDGWDEALQREPELAAAVIDAASRAGARLTAVSTDAVFAGPRVYHDEECPTRDAPEVRIALEVERAALAAGGTVVRAQAYGWCPTEGGCDFAERIWRDLEQGFPPVADAARYATPILASDLAVLVHHAYRAGLTGLYHAGGAERTCPRRFAAELAGAGGLPYLPPRDELAVHAGDHVWETSLVSHRLHQALQLPAPMVREGLARFAAQAAGGYRERLQPSDLQVEAA